MNQPATTVCSNCLGFGWEPSVYGGRRPCGVCGSSLPDAMEESHSPSPSSYKQQKREATARLCADLLQELRDFGPATARHLTGRLKRPGLVTSTVCRGLMLLLESQQVDRFPVGRNMGFVWRIPGDPRPEVDDRSVFELTTQQIRQGIDDADLEWQRYYQLPRGQRQDAPPPSSVQEAMKWRE